MIRTNAAECPFPLASIEPPPLPSQPSAACPTHTDRLSHPHSDRPPPRFDRTPCPPAPGKPTEAPRPHKTAPPGRAGTAPEAPKRRRRAANQHRPTNLPAPADPHAKRHPQPPSKTGRTDRRGIPAPASFDSPPQLENGTAVRTPTRDSKTAPPFAPPTRQRCDAGASRPTPSAMQPAAQPRFDPEPGDHSATPTIELHPNQHPI